MSPRLSLFPRTLVLVLVPASLILLFCTVRAAQNPPKTEFAMQKGDVVTAVTPEGEIAIEATSELGRKYTWAGASRSAELERRHKRWRGGLGLYSPGMGDHWEEHDGIVRGVLEEGQQHFATEETFLEWIEDTSKYMPYVYNDAGIVVGWKRYRESKKLNVEVWRVFINGEAPSRLKGSESDKIRYRAAPSKNGDNDGSANTSEEKE